MYGSRPRNSLQSVIASKWQLATKVVSNRELEGRVLRQAAQSVPPRQHVCNTIPSSIDSQISCSSEVIGYQLCVHDARVLQQNAGDNAVAGVDLLASWTNSATGVHRMVPRLWIFSSDRRLRSV